MRLKISATDVARLDKFLMSNDMMPFVELFGFLAGIISGPYFFDQDVWLEMIGFKNAKTESDPELQFAVEVVLSLFNAISLRLQVRDFDPLAMLEKWGKKDDDVIGKWAHGYLLGLNLDEEAFDEDEDKEAMGMALFVLMSLFTEDAILETKIQKIVAEDCSSELAKFCKGLKLRARKILPELVQVIYDHYQYDDYFEEEETVGPRNYRVGRNDPCPCGSGKKYKKCCLPREKD